MVVLEIDNKVVENNFKGKTNVKYSFVENLVLLNFFKKVFSKSLKKDWYDSDEINDFVESYIETYNKNNLINLKIW